MRRRFWTPAVRDAGLSPLRPHDLRHTAVALWIAAGANILEVSRRAGHTSTSFTLDRYGHLFPEADALSDRLEHLYAAPERAPLAPVVELPRRDCCALVCPECAPRSFEIPAKQVGNRP